MRPSIHIFIGLSSMLTTACFASLPAARQDYIQSRPHGLVEVTISDSRIPAVAADTERTLLRPEDCTVALLLDGEEYLVGEVFPKGATEPYSVESGFQVAAPEGRFQAEFHYTGCRRDDRETAGDTRTLSLEVRARMVSELVFDGEELKVLPLRQDTSVTLDDIYEAIANSR